MVDDYNARFGETQGRDIEHLVLGDTRDRAAPGAQVGILPTMRCIPSLFGFEVFLTPGRMESINFVHDVNILRKTMKSVYSSSADLRALNSEVDEKGPGNCRVQVLPRAVAPSSLTSRKGGRRKGNTTSARTQTRRRSVRPPCHFLAKAIKLTHLVDPSLEDITIEGVGVC